MSGGGDQVQSGALIIIFCNVFSEVVFFFSIEITPLFAVSAPTLYKLSFHGKTGAGSPGRSMPWCCTHPCVSQGSSLTAIDYSSLWRVN